MTQTPYPPPGSDLPPTMAGAATAPATARPATTSRPAGTPPLDRARAEFVVQQVRGEQNLLLGVLAGTAGALLGASLWAVITYATGYQIGWMAVGIGFLVGFLVRSAGKGIDPAHGVAGAALSLAGCILGNLLTICIAVSQQQQIPLMEVISRLNPAAIPDLMMATFHPLDILFYGLAVYYGYKLSFRQVTEAELATRPS